MPGTKLELQRKDMHNVTPVAVERFLDLVARLIAQRHIHSAGRSSTEAPARGGSPGKKSKQRRKPSTDSSSLTDAPISL
jgi:hypothetical protein